MDGIILSFLIIGISIILYIILNYSYDKEKDKIKKILSELNIKNLYSFNKSPFKILKEEDHVTSFLCLKNKDFLSGQMNGMISYYNGKTYHAIILIYEHCAPITSLFQLHDGTILTSSADGTMKKIRILLNNNNENNKKYLIEFVFYTNQEFIFKSIQLKNNDDILSCNISRELILWKKNEKDDYPLYKVDKILLNNEYIRDILQINNEIFLTCGESLQCWNTNYELIKKLLYNCKGNNSLYKINDEYSGILLEKDGNILLFNNKTLSETKILNLTSFSLTCIKELPNQIIIIGIFDAKNKKSIISQYILNNKKRSNEDKNNEPALINLKTEYVDGNWQRINIIDEIDDKIFLGFGGEKDNKYFGQIIIFDN